MTARRHSDGGGEVPRSHALEAYALGLASGILLAAPFLVPSLAAVHWLALAPWALLLRRPRAAHWLPASLLAAYGYFAMSFGPYSGLHKAAPFLAALYFFAFPVVFAVVTRIAARRTAVPLVVVVPVAWTAAEWLRVRLGEGGVSLFVLGSSQFELTPLVQIAEITGLAGVSFLVAAGSGAAADLVDGLLRPPRHWRRAVLSVSLFVFLVATAWVWGTWRLGRIETTPGPTVAVVQPNAVHYRDRARVREGFRHHAELTRELVEPGTARLVAWPENSIDVPFGDDPYFLNRLEALARDLEAPLLVGAFRRSPADPAALHTSALLVPPEGGVRATYDKLYLVPYAEYLPLEWAGRIAPPFDAAHRRLVHRLLGYVPPGRPGRELVLFSLGGDGGGKVRFAVPICYEVSDPRFPRRAVRAGADFLLNVSSEGLFGEPVYRHMWGLAVLRAVENRVPVVRAANHGISGFIAADGRPRGLVRGAGERLVLTAGALTSPVPLDAGGAGSFYTRWGDLFAYLCAAGCVALLLAARFAASPRSRSRVSRAPARSRRP